MNQTEAIRQALLELGIDASKDDVQTWLSNQKVELGRSFESIISKERKKLRDEGAPESVGGFPIERLVELRELVGDDVAAFRASVERVSRAIELTGSAENLTKFLDVWGK